MANKIPWKQLKVFFFLGCLRHLKCYREINQVSITIIRCKHVHLLLINTCALKKTPPHLPVCCLCFVQRCIYTDTSSQLKDLKHEEKTMMNGTFHNTPHTFACLFKTANICAVGELCAVYVFYL